MSTLSQIYSVASTPTAPAGSSTSSTNSTEDAQQSFLQLLVAQISNQTPDNTLDATQMITQYAQMNAALGLQKLSSSMNFQKLATAASMLNHTVTLQGRDENHKQFQTTGTVTGIDYSADDPMLIVDGNSYNLDTVVRVEA